ncbi:sporulation protein YqfD [Virgibacillus ndiopensis]|uniref:sporulation protein YqfD n=1 Tax=Virgibacillus ndiopensis TaxID=2004408 RepID=UPI000C07909F|nr:sporulation protein YqfD [Virgibacillus ndiopensis]
MKKIQGSYITGSVTILVTGHKPELFFQKCVKRGVPVWDIKKQGKTECSGKVRLHDIKNIKRIRRETNYKIAFIDKSGTPFLLKRITRRKEIVFGLLISILLIIFLSNIIWEVKITSVSKDTEKKIVKQLNNYGVHPGAWSLSQAPPSVLQQKLVNDIPELLWIGVSKKGTTYYLEGVEKSIVKEKEVQGPRNLVATKKGVIKNMYVSKGLSKVRVNDYVEPGDILVSGKIDPAGESESDKKKNEGKSKYVTAEGEIIAETWYKTEVTVPLNANFELLTGEKEKKYSLKFGDFKVPIWGFGEPEYENIHKEINENPINFFKWELPINFVETTLNEKTYNKVKRTKEEAINVGIKQAKSELLLRLEPDAKIISEKILQETTENGKVKLILYMMVEEDIARADPIQGD